MLIYSFMLAENTSKYSQQLSSYNQRAAIFHMDLVRVCKNAELVRILRAHILSLTCKVRQEDIKLLFARWKRNNCKLFLKWL